MPVSAIERFERFAKTIDVDVNTAIRMCASLQLAQFETTYVKPDASETPAQREARATSNLAELLPEVAHAITAPEPEPEPAPEQMGFQRSRSEVDELAIIGSPLVAPDVPKWTGYMANL